MNKPGDSRDPDEPRVVIRDKRRIDPESGKVRLVPVADEWASGAGAPVGLADGADPAPVRMDGASPGMAAGPVAASLQAELEERTADLQRLKAEFDNYRKRVDRDRIAVAEQAQGSVLAKLVPVLDDIDRARVHGEVAGGFKVVADALDAVVAKVGLVRFGVEGDPFDPALHEAVMHSESPDVDGPTCVTVMRAGFMFKDRLVRPAMVAVAEPPHVTPETPDIPLAPPNVPPGSAGEPGVSAEAVDEADPIDDVFLH